LNLDICAEQADLRDAFARFLNEQSSMARVRAALPSGFDQALWEGLAQLGTFSARVPQSAGGLGLSLLEATILMEEAGRTLASGPIGESVVAARLLASVGGSRQSPLLEEVMGGRCVLSLAFHDLAEQPMQWIAGGAVAEFVVARESNHLVLLHVPQSVRCPERNLGSMPIAELPVKELERTVLSAGPEALVAFSAAIEEWKLLTAAALSGLAREAIRLAAAYACERVQFGQAIGTYQGISHPLADLITEVDGGKLLIWKALRAIVDGERNAGGEISLAYWWNVEVAGRAVSQSLQSFGGYGLTTDYDIHLYNLRAKAWHLVFGDSSRALDEAGRRLYGAEAAALPEAGEMSVDFELGEDARAFAAEVNAFFEATLTPELRSKAHYSWDGHDPGVHKKLAAAHLLFPSWPREYGGRETPPYAVSAGQQVWENHGWSGHAANVTQMVGAIIRQFGSDELKREALPRIVSGDAICCLGYSEPAAGSDVFAAQTKAVRDSGVWRIDGQKMFTSGANLADYVLMLCRTNPDVPKHKGLTMFVVPMNSPGIDIQPVYTFQEERTNITYYDNVRVPDNYRLGEVDGGLKVMSAALELEHGGGGFSTIQTHMLHAAERLCSQLTYHGRPLIEDSRAQARLARTYANTQVSQLLGQRALWAGVEGKPNPGYGPMSKLFSSEKFLADAADLVELTAPVSMSSRQGPAGFLNLCYRHAHGTRIYAGTSQIHRSIIAERYLGLPRTRSK
jgi:alkylation response protein AidB-like acyl-CoA dehydrogenase